jgi:hypothetical protein
LQNLALLDPAVSADLTNLEPVRAALRALKAAPLNGSAVPASAPGPVSTPAGAPSSPSGAASAPGYGPGAAATDSSGALPPSPPSSAGGPASAAPSSSPASSPPDNAGLSDTGTLDAPTRGPIAVRLWWIEGVVHGPRSRAPRSHRSSDTRRPAPRPSVAASAPSPTRTNVPRCLPRVASASRTPVTFKSTVRSPSARPAYIGQGWTWNVDCRGITRIPFSFVPRRLGLRRRAESMGHPGQSSDGHADHHRRGSPFGIHLRRDRAVQLSVRAPVGSTPGL